VTFQFLGKGDSSLQNLFQIFDADANIWVTKWDSKSATNGTTGVSGLITPIYTDAPGSSFTQFFKAGLIGFRFETIGANGLIADVSNDGFSNIHDNPIGPHFFLGVDPYLATGKFDNSGSAVFAGLTDQGFVTAGDHDYEDLVVRISVPEPGILALLMAGLLSFGVLRRRQAASDAVGLLA